jgi:hypothetical protein
MKWMPIKCMYMEGKPPYNKLLGKKPSLNITCVPAVINPYEGADSARNRRIHAENDTPHPPDCLAEVQAMNVNACVDY